MNKVLSLLFFLLLFAPLHAQVVTYPAPQGAELKQDFTVEVRQGTGPWRAVDTYAVKVDEVRGTKHCVELASLAYFDFEGRVQIRVTSHKGMIDQVRVRPLSYGIRAEVADSVLTFSLDRPRNLSVEVNGDIFHNLHLFANPIDWNNPLLAKGASAKGLARQMQRVMELQPRLYRTDAAQRAKLKHRYPEVLYFGPGVHHLPGDTLDVPSDRTVYIAGGARVYGQIRVKNVRNVKVLGRGIVHPKGRGEGVYIMNSKNVDVEGIISTQVPVGGSDSVRVRNVKVISSYGWGDGLNVFASNNVSYDGCFARTSDDCTTVYATRKGFTGGCRNISMRRSVLWADVAHPIFIGLHGNVPHPDTIEDVLYQDIDILDHAERQINYQGCLSINAGDNNLVRRIRFENIRIEDFRRGQLFQLRIFYNKKYCQAPGRGIEDVLFKDITYTGTGEEMSLIIGYNEERKVKNVRFENLKVNGKVISDDMPDKPKWYATGDMARIFVGEHAENVTFTK